MISTQNKEWDKRERKGVEAYKSVLVEFFLIIVVAHVISLAFKYYYHSWASVPYTFQNSCDDVSKDI